MTDVLDLRALFPGTEKRTYLDTACLGLVSSQTDLAIGSLLGDMVKPPLRSSTENMIKLFEISALARNAIAKFIDTTPDQIALINSTTHGIQIASQAIPICKGDNIIICDLEFLGIITPWLIRSRDVGFEVRPVKTKDGCIDIDDFINVMDKRTKAVVVSSVQEVNGYRCNLGQLFDVCHQNGTYLVVDAIQHIGSMNFNINETPVDFLSCGGHKWLTAPFGCGFLYVRSEINNKLSPASYGYMSINEPPGGWDAYLSSPGRSPFEDFSFTSKAEKFEIGGTPNFCGTSALLSAFNLFNSIGANRIEEHILGLTSHLVNGLKSLKVKIISSQEGKHRSGIVTFCLLSDNKNEEWELKEYLFSKNIYISLRYISGIGGIRVSPHIYNNLEDLDRLLNHINCFLSHRKN